MTMDEVMQPKWFLATKRGLGMAMAGIGALVPLLASYMGWTFDTASWSEFTKMVADWFEVTWNVIAYGLWIWGSWRPTAPLAVTKPV